MDRQAEWKDGIEQTREGDANKVVSGVVIAVAAGIMFQVFVLYLLG
jgi:hypothetical protein